MSETESIEFTLKGDVEGVPITPRTIGLSQFNAFNQQVETFISGSERLKLDEAHVEIEEGSYKLKVLLPLVAAVALETDLRLLAREDSLGEIDPAAKILPTRLGEFSCSALIRREPVMKSAKRTQVPPSCFISKPREFQEFNVTRKNVSHHIKRHCHFEISMLKYKTT